MPRSTAHRQFQWANRRSAVRLPSDASITLASGTSLAGLFEWRSKARRRYHRGDMNMLPKSRTARRRLRLFFIVAPVVTMAAALALYGLRGSISYFYTPAQAFAAHVPTGRPIELGGMVETGSLSRRPDGEVNFSIRDRRNKARVSYRGDLPDLFREGQGVVASGAFDATGTFVASQILAKHDERYMPRELTRALRAQGEWRGGSGGAQPL
jgi:cytochrome c-type biogenesis protein CcmE